ncbi:serine hydrolase domain-containing protein [Microbacterium sp. USHLN186]|uniref:serine hydrolase domain-containing protein n=1 Tax=Microbacterium sp. USHLN186 TaxID=3081286 RepID=UPI003017C315
MGFDSAFDWARSHVAEGRLPTAVLGVATADGTVALDGFGTGTDASYPLFSITKALMGITAARAVERGLLTAETPLTAAVPEFGRKRDDIVQLRHLVSHTSGISEPPLDTAVPLRTELVAQGRDFAAGTASRYSTLAFEGVAALTEHATGVPWDEDTRRWAASVGADGLTLEHDGALDVPDAAAGGLDMTRFRATRSPGAGLVGSAQDLLRIGSALLRIHGGEQGGILAPATLRMMLRPLTGAIPRLEPYPAERGQDWGFAFNLRTRAPGLIDQDVYGHGGWAGTEFWVHPSAGLCWVLLTNRAVREGVDADELDNAVVSGR